MLFRLSKRMFVEKTDRVVAVVLFCFSNVGAGLRGIIQADVFSHRRVWFVRNQCAFFLTTKSQRINPRKKFVQKRLAQRQANRAVFVGFVPRIVYRKIGLIHIAIFGKQAQVIDGQFPFFLVLNLNICGEIGCRWAQSGPAHSP